MPAGSSVVEGASLRICKTRFFAFPGFNIDEVKDGSARPNLDVRPHDVRGWL